MKKETFVIQGMHCVSCALTIEQAIKKVPGVKNASVNLMSEKAIVEYEEPATPELLEIAVAKTGYKLITGAAETKSEHGDHHKMLKEAEIKLLKNKFIIGAILSVFIMIFSLTAIVPDLWRYVLLLILTAPIEF